MKRLRVGVVSYLNSRPLAGDLGQDERLELVEVPPAEVARGLLGGAFDIGLVPVVALLRDPSLTYLPGLCIGAERRVDSVFLHARPALFDPASARPHRVALDPHSRTSQMLTRIVLAEVHGLHEPVVTYTETSPREALAAAPGTWDGVLVIGDLALRVGEVAGWRKIDLATAWAELTGLPFVFAVWGTRGGVLVANPWLGERFRRALDAGMADLERLAQTSAASYGVEAAVALGYWRDRIRFRMGEREEAGLAAFLQRVRDRERRDDAGPEVRS